MPTQASLEAMETAELIQQVDDGRTDQDFFKLPDWLRSLLDVTVDNLQNAETATLSHEGDRTTAAIRVREASAALAKLLRDGYNHIRGLGSYDITDAERQGLYATYGWQGGEMGDLKDEARLESLATTALDVTPTITTEAHRYPPMLVQHLTAQLTILNANQSVATTGGRGGAIKLRNQLVDLLERVNARVRFYYCAASQDLDQTPELNRIGMQPRRNPGQAQAQPKPATPDTVTLNSADLTLSLPALPEHATTLRAYRQPAGGEAVLAGTSPTTTVSVVGLEPLTSGVQYEFWVVGHNSAGDGPESNHIQHTAA